MSKEEFIFKAAELIINDWRSAMYASDDMRASSKLPNDETYMVTRAFEEAKKIADTIVFAV